MSETARQPEGPSTGEPASGSVAAACSAVRRTVYVIRLDRSVQPCWLNLEVDGDPGRTLVFAHATRFATEREARKARAAVRRQYRRRHFVVEQVAE